MTFSDYLRSLTSARNLPKWVQPLDEMAAILTVKRYKQRMSNQRKPRAAESWYQKYLLSQHWRGFRMAVFVLAGGKCCRCGDVADHVHHLHYKTVGREALTDVEPLCERCHSEEHDVIAKTMNELKGKR